MPAHATRTAEDLRARLRSAVPVDERHIDAAGIDTAVWEGGEGEPIVLLHGAGEFCGVWNRVIGNLAADHRVTVPDLPGHGATGLGDGPLDAARASAWLDELIGATCPAPPVLVGHLLGGAMAARYTIDHPDRVSHLVLVDSLGLARYRPTFRFSAALVGFMVRPTEGTQRRLMDACMADLEGMRSEMDGGLEDMEAYALDRAKDPTMKRALRSLMPALGMPAIDHRELDSIAVPTTLIWGHDDLQVKLEVAEAAAARHSWPLHVIDDTGDDPAAEHPTEFLAALRGALADSGPEGE